MSREAFEQWWQTIKNGWFYFSKLELAERAWRACEQHYQQRIAELEAQLANGEIVSVNELSVADFRAGMAALLQCEVAQLCKLNKADYDKAYHAVESIVKAINLNVKNEKLFGSEIYQAAANHYEPKIAELEAKLHKEHHDAKTCPVCGVETATVEWIRERKELEAKLANMAALVAKKDEAINAMLKVAYALPPTTEAEHAIRSRDVHDATEGLKQALALIAEDVELVEAINVSDEEWNKYKSTGEGPKLYKIQMKGK